MAMFAKKNKEINKVVMIPINLIQKSPAQPRQHFDITDLKELAQSISANGLLQPITVRKTEDSKYELIAGERRTIACKSLGHETIPAIIENFSNEKCATLSLIENMQRKDLNYFEEATGIAMLMRDQNLNQIQVCQTLGKAQSTVANKLRLLRYPPDLQQIMIENDFTERHARALLKLTDESHLRKAVNAIAKNNFTVEQTEQLVQNILTKPQENRGTRIFIIKDMRMFMNTIQKAVSTMNQAGIPVDTQKTEDDDFVEVLIKIPKSAVYKGDAKTPHVKTI